MFNKTFKDIFGKYLDRNRAYFQNKVVVDFPAGSGETSKSLTEAGLNIRVLPFDLFPEFFKFQDLNCRKLSAGESFPLEAQSVDAIICQEGLEHFSDQWATLREFNRILKPTGRLILTTPNYSNLTSRMSYFLSESERFHRLMPPNEVDSVWLNQQSQDPNIYVGHVFLIGIQKLRLLAKLSGLEIRHIHFSEIKSTALFLFLIFYPFILASNLVTYLIALRRNPQARTVYQQALKLAIDPRILVDGSLIVEFEKTIECDQVRRKLQQVGSFQQDT